MIRFMVRVGCIENGNKSRISQQFIENWLLMFALAGNLKEIKSNWKDFLLVTKITAGFQQKF